MSRNFFMPCGILFYNLPYPFVNVIAAFIIGAIISVLALGLYSVCIYFVSGYLFTIKILMLSIALILFSSLVNSFILGCLCSFFKSNSAFSVASILIGTIIGFVNGLYVPLGGLSKSVVNVLLLFPSLHIAAVFRSIVTQAAISEVFINAPKQIIDDYLLNYGILLKFNDNQLTSTMSLLYAIAFGVLGLIIMILNLKKKSKEL